MDMMHLDEKARHYMELMSEMPTEQSHAFAQIRDHVNATVQGADTDIESYVMMMVCGRDLTNEFYEKLDQYVQLQGYRDVVNMLDRYKQDSAVCGTEIYLVGSVYATSFDHALLLYLCADAGIDPASIFTDTL